MPGESRADVSGLNEAWVKFAAEQGKREVGVWVRVDLHRLMQHYLQYCGVQSYKKDAFSFIHVKISNIIVCEM
jgi:hypothetical protein